MACSHLRLRNFKEHGRDEEAFIKHLEKKLCVDIRDLPKWKELVNLLHHNTTDYERAIQSSKERKRLILDKLLVQTTRPSPFELTANLSRTYKVWKDMEKKIKIKKSLVKFEPQNKIESVDLEETMTNEQFTAHPNSEIIEEDTVTTEKNIKVDTDAEAGPESHLPTFVCGNKHKIVSPLGSKDSRLSYKSMKLQNYSISESEEEWLRIERTTTVRARPDEIIILNSSMKEEKILFSIINCGLQFKYLRFVTVTNSSQFRYIKISPLHTIKLIPGISVNFCLKYKLVQNTEAFLSGLFFRIGRNVICDAPNKGLFIPVHRRLAPRKVTVTEVVNLPPAYHWHISGTFGYPTGIINILCEDPYNYEVQITKRVLDYDKEPDEAQLSAHALSLDTESVRGRDKYIEIDKQPEFPESAKSPKSPKSTIKSLESKNVKSEIDIEAEKEKIDIVLFICEEIVSGALESFKIDRKNFELRPYSIETVTVCLTKHEHIGYHQCLYDIVLYDLNSRELLMTKLVQVRAEVLPHPVSISPTILDMSATAIVTHGFVEDKIVFYNSHRYFQVCVKIKLSTKMKKIFEVAPSEVVVSPLSSRPVIVRFCTRSFLIKNVTDELVLFTVKMLFSGNQTIYKNVPPLYYEIIAPCAFEFKQTYKEQYFKDVDSSSRHKNRDNKSFSRH